VDGAINTGQNSLRLRAVVSISERT
jgi:hypothetical protein